MTDPVEPAAHLPLPQARVTNYGTWPGRPAGRRGPRGGPRRSAQPHLPGRRPEAGVTHGSYVHHFGSRDALTEEAVSHAIHSSLNSSALEIGTGKPADFAAARCDMVDSGPELQAFQHELPPEARRRPELLPHSCAACTRSTSGPARAGADPHPGPWPVSRGMLAARVRRAGGPRSCTSWPSVSARSPKRHSPSSGVSLERLSEDPDTD
ncbi:TetR/AcrR family transcriptional regulator [Streptomyces sp. KL116D]|uniref:TetR/AcrR family transcriptional regulator n=1 Tax=Streptomyces sp. KL116D TaxID=3045152 RepID=UPI003555F98A